MESPWAPSKFDRGGWKTGFKGRNAVSLLCVRQQGSKGHQLVSSLCVPQKCSSSEYPCFSRPCMHKEPVAYVVFCVRSLVLFSAVFVGFPPPKGFFWPLSVWGDVLHLGLLPNLRNLLVALCEN